MEDTTKVGDKDNDSRFSADQEGVYRDSEEGYDHVRVDYEPFKPGDELRLPERIKWKCQPHSGERCLNCGGSGFYIGLHPNQATDTLIAETVEKTMTTKRTLTPIINREPNGRRSRDLFSNATLDDQITWIKGRLSDVNNPILSTRQRQAARLQLAHCLEKDREHKLPANLRPEAERVAREPLPNLPRIKAGRIP